MPCVAFFRRTGGLSLELEISPSPPPSLRRHSRSIRAQPRTHIPYGLVKPSSCEKGPAALEPVGPRQSCSGLRPPSPQTEEDRHLQEVTQSLERTDPAPTLQGTPGGIRGPTGWDLPGAGSGGEGTQEFQPVAVYVCSGV